MRPWLGGDCETRTLIWDLEACLAEQRRRCGERLAMSQQETPIWKEAPGLGQGHLPKGAWGKRDDGQIFLERAGKGAG